MNGPQTADHDARYCFVLPDLWRPMGGQAVLYDMATTLHRAGHETVLIHGGRFHRYPYAETECEIYHLPGLAAVNRAQGLRNRVQRIPKRFAERRHNPPAPRFHSTARDVMVIPEFSYHTYADLFPGARLVMMVQDPTALLIAFSRDVTGAHMRYGSVLATSEAAVRGVHTLLECAPHGITLPVARPDLKADHPKKLQIAYMPRKLRSQSERVIRALKQRLALADVPVVVIENMTNAERDKVLNESLIFLSFSNMEGFGLPPAEAMAAGCLVIGYTGVGAQEFFTADTGFVIEQNDMLGMIAKVEEVITAYRQDPVPLDRLRANAAAVITMRYTQDRAGQSLLAAWDAVDADLCEQ